MKITGAISYVKVEIEGELIIGGFVVYKDTIKNWKPLCESETVDSMLKQKRMDMIV